MSSLEKGDTVRVIDGVFAGFVGVVDDIGEDRRMVRVVVEIFGRLTPVVHDVLQLEKMGS